VYSILIIFCYVTTQPGLAATVAYRGETILTVNEGVIDKKSTPSRKPDGDTIFRIGSISKVFVVSLLCSTCVVATNFKL